MSLFEFDESSDLPMWAQIKDRFAYLINSGYYQPGHQLPSVRAFAAELMISYNTVSKAYMALEREGYIVTKRGSGAYVRDLGDVPDESGVDALVDEFIKACIGKGLNYDDIPGQVLDGIRRMKRGGHGEEESRG